MYMSSTRKGLILDKWHSVYTIEKIFVIMKMIFDYGKMTSIINH